MKAIKTLIESFFDNEVEKEYTPEDMELLTKQIAYNTLTQEIVDSKQVYLKHKFVTNAYLGGDTWLIIKYNSNYYLVYYHYTDYDMKLIIIDGWKIIKKDKFAVLEEFNQKDLYILKGILLSITDIYKDAECSKKEYEEEIWKRPINKLTSPLVYPLDTEYFGGNDWEVSIKADTLNHNMYINGDDIYNDNPYPVFKSRLLLLMFIDIIYQHTKLLLNPDIYFNYKQ